MTESKLPDLPLEERIIQDAINKIAILLGNSERLQENPAYHELPPDIKDRLATMDAAGQNTVGLLQQLSRLYRAKEQGVELVELNLSELEEVVTPIYNVVHVDGEAEILESLSNALSKGSNLIPSQPGYFSHNGEIVLYKVHSYQSIEEALREIPEFERIHLLMTGLTLGLNGYDLLDELNKPVNKESRRKKYDNVQNIAMLTVGITQEDAERVQQTYGATVLTTPFRPLALEKQIFYIVNPITPQS